MRYIRHFIFLLALCWQSFCISATIDQKELVKFIGYYSNEKVYDITGDPHVSGYTLTLYRQGFNVFGIFSSSDAIAGDTPKGRIDDVQYNPKSHKFSFVAKLTTGTTFDQKTGQQIPAKDLFEFEGLLLKTKVSGSLVHKDGYDLEKKGIVKKIVLRKKNAKQENYEVPDSYERWLQLPIYNGPKW